MTSLPSAEPAPVSLPRRRVWFASFAQRHPFVYLFLLLGLSNVAGSVFNILYNLQLIVNSVMDRAQKAAFQDVALPIYNVFAYPICLGVGIALMVPLIRCRRRWQRGEAIPPEKLEMCRRRIVNFPFLQVVINFLGWFPGAVFFPAVVCSLGGSHAAGDIWWRFFVSFVISAFYTTFQTFFLLEWFLVAVIYPDLFQDARPAEVRGVVRIPFGVRMIWLWLAVGVMPLVAVTAMAYYSGPGERWATVVVAFVGVVSAWSVFAVVRSDIQHWIRIHRAATDAIARENFAVRVQEQRPDEWGRLTDHFNDMAAALGRAEQLRETFGQFVSPEVRDDILERYPGLQVSVQEITVLFADIRGFTRRCAGLAPERAGSLLNRFLTLALGAIEENGGYVNKFLGDGILALFGATHPDPDHADLALRCAREMLVRLERLNDELRREGIDPLVIGIGIHTGPALVGCFGATLAPDNGRPRIRREFSAIGETVNFGQRIEQMTKQLGGPILLSAATRERLHSEVSLVDHGPQPLSGAPEPMRLFQVKIAGPGDRGTG